MGNEIEINVQERIKAERKQDIEDFNYQGMTESEIADEVRRERELYDRLEREYREEIEINVQERIKAERKQAIEDFNYQGMTESEIADEVRRERDLYDRIERQDREEDAWQEWMGNPLYLTECELKKHEAALEHEAIELSFIG